MKYCPKCGYSYNPDAEKCPDCNEKLISMSDEDMEKMKNAEFEENSDMEFTALPTFPGQVYAELVKGVLDAKGIPCYIRGSGAAGALFVMGGGSADVAVRLYVPGKSMNVIS